MRWHKNGQRYCLDVRGDISERLNIFHMFPFKSLVFGDSILKIICIADYQAHGFFVTNVLNTLFKFNTYFLMRIILNYK